MPTDMLSFYGHINYCLLLLCARVTDSEGKKDLSSLNVLGFDRIDFYAAVTIIVTWKQTRGQCINMPGDKVDE